MAHEIVPFGNRHTAFKYCAYHMKTSHFCTNYLALATALELVAGCSDESVDFGFTDMRSVSLRAYKARRGGEARPAYFSATPLALLADTLEPGRLLTKAIQRTPMFVAQIVGSLAYPFVT